MKVMNWRMAYAVHTGTLTPASASAAKVYGTEVEIEAYRLLLDVLGRAGYLRRGSPGAVLEGRVEQAYRDAPVRTFGGGSNEVQREIIAWTALGTPRGGR
jgi:alkylation response protein AidB-like acyl-CoA dehydrogenase